MRRIHGQRKTRLYNIWANMIQRCNNPNNTYYNYYGGKGISVCEEWLHSFSNFYAWAYSTGYEEVILDNGYSKWTIDRINSEGNYCPDNCRWALNQDQQRNKSVVKRVICLETNQVFNNLNDAQAKTGINKGTICRACKNPIKMAGGYHFKYVN